MQNQMVQKEVDESLPLHCNMLHINVFIYVQS